MLKIIKKLHSVIRETSKTIFRSSKWKSVRNNFLEKNHFCAACGSKTKLQVHHVKPFHLHPELELDENNLITLCMEDWDCHLQIGHGDSFQCYNPDIVTDAKKFKIASQEERKKLIQEIKKKRLKA